MAGLTASELAPKTLYPGDTIEYYSRGFVWGDKRGHRFAVVTRVDDGSNVEFPVAVNTGEIIPHDMMMKRVLDRFGNPVEDEATTWRKLRTYQLSRGEFSAPSRASALKLTLEHALQAAFESARQVLRIVPDEIVPESPRSQSDPPSPHLPDQDPPSPAVIDLTSPAREGGDRVPPDTNGGRERTTQTTSIHDIFDLVSSQENDAQPSGSVVIGAERVSDALLEKVAAYIKPIPNRRGRAKIRHQGKDRHGVMKRSRKRKDQAMCAITRSGNEIYHAKAVKAVQIKKLLSSPEVKLRLKNLHARRQSFLEAPQLTSTAPIEEVPWPQHVKGVTTCSSSDISFRDIGEFDPCQCIGDCFMDVCTNVATATFYTPTCCSLGARSSNAPRTLGTLKLFDTGRVGLGVYTTTNLDIGDVLGEYCGELTELPAIVAGQPDQAVKENSGFTLLYNTKSAKHKYVYVDALKSGSITRFICHACDPNAAFVEQQNRSEVKVVVKMIKDVKAGAEITVHYGEQRWFTCACNDCWPDKTRGKGRGGKL